MQNALLQSEGFVMKAGSYYPISYKENQERTEKVVCME